MKKTEIIFGALRLPIDFAAIIAAFLLAYYLRPITDLIPFVQYNFYPELLPPIDEYFRLAVYSGLFLIIIFIFNNLYSLKITHSYAKEFFRIIFLVSAWLMFIIAYYFLIVHQLFFSRIALAHIWVFTIIFVAAGRGLIILIQSFLLRFGIGQRCILFIGANTIADQFYNILKKDHRYKIVGSLADKHTSRKHGTLKIINTISNIANVIKKYGVEEIIQADKNLKSQTASDLLDFCRANQIKYHFIPDLIRLQRTNVETEMIDNMPLISLRQTPLDGWGHIYKRFFDIVFSLILIILLLPVWIIVSIIIKLASPGPIFYTSRRKHHNKIFNIYKFRSMVANADRQKAKLIAKNERRGPLFKIKNDPRVTRVGKFLRKTSIDELPQLFNVLIGNMSLVGPRPHLPEEIAKYESHHRQVFAVKPGVTGLAQISGRSNLDFDKEIKLDVYYIENWSLWMDIVIIFKSIGVVLKAEGH